MHRHQSTGWLKSLLRTMLVSIFYTREAHPAENYPQLTSMEQKFRYTQNLRDKLGVTRPIVLDSLDGQCHRTFGAMPKKTWSFNKALLPIYKSEWTDAVRVENAIAYFLEVIDRMKAGQKLAHFRVERLDYQDPNREAFYQGLERNGPAVVKQFREAFG